MHYYRKDRSSLHFAKTSTKLLLLGVIFILVSVVSFGLTTLVEAIPQYTSTGIALIHFLFNFFLWISLICFFIGGITFIIMIIKCVTFTTADRFYYLLKKRLFCSEYGNPLSLKEGDKLPTLNCKETKKGQFEIVIATTTHTVEELRKIQSTITAALPQNYAVTRMNSDLGQTRVCYYVEDIQVDKTLYANAVQSLLSGDPTKLIIQKDTYIDLTTSGSMLVAGKTRSGKTTAIISILSQILYAGKDNFGSSVVIIDPKKAELSRLPHVVTIDEEGEAIQILEAVKDFDLSIRKRQQILNDLSEKKGDAVHWWDANMHPSILFIDEYVALRGIFPRKASKEQPKYCLDTFDDQLKKIITMGASAGCFVTISLAEASAGEGGLPTMLKNALSTKVLLKPTLTEGRFIWDAEKLESVATDRDYMAGDAWFSSTDGEHELLSSVHFPVMNFPIYRQLGTLLTTYYK